MENSQAVLLNQLKQLENPDVVVTLNEPNKGPLLGELASSWQGIVTCDDNRFIICFWEVPFISSLWQRLQKAPTSTGHYLGRNALIRWENGMGALHLNSKAHNFPPKQVLNLHGIAIQKMRRLNCTLYTGDIFADACCALVAEDKTILKAIWCYCASDQFSRDIRSIYKKVNVTVGTFVKVPFDLEYWQKVAEERYPDDLPEPHSDDPTQWLFRGDIPTSTEPLHAAMARLLGYRWPDQPERDEWVDPHVDGDGIVTLQPLQGKEGAANRLRALLKAAYESPAPPRPKGAPPVKEPREWNESTVPRLLERVGCSGMTLEEWLRDRFFASHCKLFHQRPFIWHIWDGRKDGFHAFVNYHRLDKAKLERLTYTYLGQWIELQQLASEGGDPMAEARLAAAQELKRRLVLILEGESPYDIFVRWKPVHEQPIGWEPDLNDGVRPNIRPFSTAGVLRSKVDVNWNKDRGKDPYPNATGTVERFNDRHFTLEEKRKAREGQG